MDKKVLKYERLFNQIEELTKKLNNPLSRMATICAVLHHKHESFFWTGFYLLSEEGELEVACYQGPLACMRLKKHTGVCWAGIDSQKPVIVEDVCNFEGHIACNPLSKSEIVIPLFNNNKITGVLDIDSSTLNTFGLADAEQLEKIVALIYKKY